LASCDWLTAPALLNTSYWSVIYRDKKPKQAFDRFQSLFTDPNNASIA